MNRNFIFASLVLAIVLNIGIIGCHRKGDNESNIHPDSARAQFVSNTDTFTATGDSIRNPYENSNVEIKVFANDDVLKGFGYDVYIDKSPYVHQPHIPAIAGNRGFSSSEFAQRTGEFVAYKIKNNIMPPSISPAELDSLGVLK